MNTLSFKSVSVMAFTQDNLESQLPQSEIQQLIKLIKYIGATHVALHIPLDNNLELISHSTVPQHLTVEDYLALWCREIHNAGLSVVFRGTFSGIVNAYGFGYEKNVSIGTLESAAADGTKTWLGRVYNWLEGNGKNFKEGDVLALIPEPTNTAFNGNFFLSSEPDTKVNFLEFFMGIHQLEMNYLAKHTITSVYSGMTSNTYQDIMSEWIPMQLFDMPSIMNVDYLSLQDDAQTTKSKLLELYDKFKLPVFLQEWTNTTDDQQAQDAFAIFEELIDANVLIGLNYWSGFIGGKDDLFSKDKNGVWIVTERGRMLAKLFAYGATEKKVQATVPVKTDLHKEETSVQTEQPQKLFFGLSLYDIPFLTTLTVSVLLGCTLTVLTSILFFHSAFTIFTPYLEVVYTVMVALVYAILDGR